LEINSESAMINSERETTLTKTIKKSSSHGLWIPNIEKKFLPPYKPAKGTWSDTLHRLVLSEGLNPFQRRLCINK
jgi:hypothetical protein